MFLQCHFYISILFTHLSYRLNCIYLFLRLVSASLQASARQREAQQRANVLRDMESVAKVRISTDEFSSFFKNEIWVFSCVCSSKLKFAKRAAYSYLVWFGVWCLICTVNKLEFCFLSPSSRRCNVTKIDKREIIPSKVLLDNFHHQKILIELVDEKVRKKEEGHAFAVDYTLFCPFYSMSVIPSAFFRIF